MRYHAIVVFNPVDIVFEETTQIVSMRKLLPPHSADFFKHGTSAFQLDASRQKISRLQLEEMASTSTLGTLSSLLKLMNIPGSLPALEAPPS